MGFHVMHFFVPRDELYKRKYEIKNERIVFSESACRAAIMLVKTLIKWLVFCKQLFNQNEWVLSRCISPPHCYKHEGCEHSYYLFRDDDDDDDNGLYETIANYARVCCET